jgi:hypothetical protein
MSSEGVWIEPSPPVDDKQTGGLCAHTPPGGTLNLADAANGTMVNVTSDNALRSKVALVAGRKEPSLAEKEALMDIVTEESPSPTGSTFGSETRGSARSTSPGSRPRRWS